MSVYSFSIKPTHLEGEVLIKKVKAHCTKHGLDFSAVVLDALKLWEKNTYANKRRD